MLREFFGTAPEDEPVAAVVRRAVDDMKARGATAIDVVVPNLTQQLTASSLLTQELKFDLRDYLRRSRGARIKSLEELLSSGLHTAQFQGFIEGANALADDYPASADYRARLAAREALGRAVLAVMDETQARRARVSDGAADRAARRRQSGRLQRRAVCADRISGDHGARRVHGRRIPGRRRTARPPLRGVHAVGPGIRLRERDTASPPAGRHASTRRHHARRRRPDHAFEPAPGSVTFEVGLPARGRRRRHGSTSRPR